MMEINLEHCKLHQKDMDYHPKFWEKPDGELTAILWTRYTESKKRLREIGGQLNLSVHERGLLMSAREFIEIIESGTKNRY